LGAGAASPGDVASLVSTQMLISGYLRDIGQHVRNAQQAIHEMEDIATYSETAPHIGDIPGAATLRVTEGAFTSTKSHSAMPGLVSVSTNVSRSRSGRGKEWVLSGRPAPASRPSSSCCNGFTTSTAGRILIDEQDIAKVSQVSLRQAIGLVPQEPVLFHRSLSENIAYGRPQVPPVAIQKAASLAHADIFIDRLPKTYRTAVGERGVKLSAASGKGWRLPARSFAATPILVLE